MQSHMVEIIDSNRKQITKVKNDFYIGAEFYPFFFVFLLDLPAYTFAYSAGKSKIRKMY